MTQVTNITTAEAKTRKAALELKLRELTGVSLEREDLKIEPLADPADQVTSSVNRELTIERLDRQSKLARDVQSALVKIREGSYGLCERCEEPIPRKRLDAVPWARLCIACQSEAEAAEREGKVAFESAA